ncbi:2'-5' RNA ligase family protein (plasmid) [Streptomycetaceae bacterium NBC_01309]
MRERSEVRRHLMAVLPDTAVAELVLWRQSWDPVMAAVVPAHVTIVYPEETADEALLLERADEQFAGTAPFRLRLGEVVAAGDGRDGVFVSVSDVDGTWGELRRRLLVPPMTRLRVVPAHATVVHPRTSGRGPECFAELGGRSLHLEVTVREVQFTETTATRMSVIRRFALAAP